MAGLILAVAVLAACCPIVTAAPPPAACAASRGGLPGARASAACAKGEPGLALMQKQQWVEKVLQRGATEEGPGLLALAARFAPADGGKNRACRGAAAGDDSTTYYIVHSGVQDLDSCKAQCDSTDACQGIEFSPGRCEVWIRPGGIGATAERAGCTCLRVEFAPVDGGKDRACRGANASDNSANYYSIDVSGRNSLEACKESCRQRPAECSGIEYTKGRCEVWTRAAGVGASDHRTGFTCLRFHGGGAGPETTPQPRPTSTWTTTATPTPATSQASDARFLIQATFGPTWESLKVLKRAGSYERWIAEQMALPVESHREYYRRRANPGIMGGAEGLKSGSPRPRCKPGSRWVAYALRRSDEGQALRVVNGQIFVGGDLRTDVDPGHSGNGLVAPEPCTDRVPDNWQSRGMTCKSEARSMAWNCPSEYWVEERLCQQTCFDEGYGYAGDDCSIGWTSLAEYDGYVCDVKTDAVGSYVKLSALADCRGSVLPMVNPAVWRQDLAHDSSHSALRFKVFRPGVLLLAESLAPCNLATFVRSDAEAEDGAERFYLLEQRLELVENTPESPASSGSWAGGKCPGVARTFLNERGCRLLPGCLSPGTQRLPLRLNASALKQFFSVGGRYVYAVTKLRPTTPPCRVLSRWQRLNCPSPSCVATSLSQADEDDVRSQLQAAEGQGWLRDVETACQAVPAAAVVQVGSDHFQHVHDNEHNVYDFTDWVSAHPGGPAAIQKWTGQDFKLEFPEWHPMERWEAGTAPGVLQPNFLGKYDALVDLAALPQPLQTQELAAALGVAEAPPQEYAVVCGSPGEVANEPALGHHLSLQHGGAYVPLYDVDYESQWGVDRLSKSAVWTMKALYAEDQLRQRVAWALSQVFVLAVSGGDWATFPELWLSYYDIFVRHAFGNFRDVLREVTYNPLMGDYLTYKRNRAFDSRNTFPDENYAREIMQLFTIGLWKLNPDGSRVRDAEGEGVPTYSNEHIMNFARVFTGFDEQPARANMEYSRDRNLIDPMRMQATWHDVYPKPDLENGFLGDGYPLCSDLPARGFLGRGAKYSFLGHNYADVDVFTVDSGSSLHAALCGGSLSAPSAGCQYQLAVELDSRLPCHSEECAVGTVRIVNVSGGFYEYVPPMCVNLFFFNGRVAANGGRSWGWRKTCKNPHLPVAGAACCGGCKNTTDWWMSRYGHTCENATNSYPEMFTKRCRHNEWWADRKYCQLACWQGGAGYEGDNCSTGAWRGQRVCGYPQERVPLATAEQRCASLGLEVCNERLEGYGCGYDDAPVWTPDSCSYDVVVRADGKVASNLTSQTRQNSFAVPWLDGRFPVVANGSCPEGCLAASGACSCVMRVETRRAFTEVPGAAELLARLKIGALPPTVPCTAGCDGEVKAYAAVGTIDQEDTVFEYRGKFFKNQEAVVVVGSYAFRNPPVFMSSEAPDARAALAEVESLLDHLFRHQNTPVFISHRLIQRMTSSNPSRAYVRDVADAFRTGRYGGATYSGAYGDLAATAAAVLLHPEARNQSSASNGVLREPLLKVIHFMRSMDYRDRADRVVLIENLMNKIGQWPFSSPSVFNFYLPDHKPDTFPDGLVGPEFEIFTPPMAIGLANGLTSLIDLGLGQCEGGFGFHSSSCSNGRLHASEAECLHTTIDELDLLLTGGRLSNKGAVRSAYLAAEGGDQFKAAQRAVVMTPEFHTLGRPRAAGPRPPAVPRLAPPARSYRAAVMVFLSGGADTFNLLVPLNCPLYDEYRQVRQQVALEARQLHAVRTEGQACAEFGVHPQLPFVKELYDLGEAAFISNLGSLVEPLTKETYWRGGAKCEGLYSHSDQQLAAQTLKCQTSMATSKGAGGRIADALAAGGQRFSTMSFSVGGFSTWSQGFETTAEVIDKRTGTVRFEKYDELKAVIANVTSVRHGNIYCEEYAQRFTKAIDFNEELGRQLRRAVLKTAFAGGDTDLSRQLKQVARLIAAHGERQAERDFFFVSITGFDTHQSVTRALDERFREVDAALRAFVAELKAQEVFESTVLMTHSDFGRTLTPNSGAGTDHAWAGNHLVIGGAINGGRVFNSFPASFMEGAEQDAGRGRLIPKYPWESMMVPVAEWLGLEEHQSAQVFPNLGNFNRSLHIIARAALFKS